MEAHKMFSVTYLLFLTLTIFSATSARTLEEQPLVPVVPPVVSNTIGTPSINAEPVVTPSASQPATVADADDHHSLVFFLHDILGGTNPTARAMTGIVNSPAVNGQVPFAKPNGAVLPFNNGIPQNNNNNGILSNNNIPFLTGLSGATQNVVQNNNNNNNNFINGGQLFPGGSTLQNLMFGTMSVFDDELTEGHELGSGLVGKAQGFYVVSSEDGTSQTMAFTAMFQSGGYADSLSFFGVHRVAASESHLAIMGGTGKYVDAKGLAIVKTFPAINEHQTDGAETLLQFTVYITY
ncbi:dirigent protein 25-like [Rosa rugosa]|uniref:dirigent protein 25-like n=1 Tax=Rosa rugosa TaxID=74645 RepID=UPI002B41809C|nr:dirigent protein 25-like [Rosa rugosa]